MIGRYAVLRRLRAEFQKSDVRPWMRGSSGKDSGPASARCRSLSTDWHAVLRFPGCKAAIAGKTEGADPGTKPVGPVGSGTWSGLGSREQQRIWRSGPSADGQWDDRDWDRGTRIRAAANAGGNGRREGAWWPTARSRDFGSRGEKEGEKDGNRSRRRRQRPVSDSRRESQAVRSASEVGKGTGCRWCWESDREVGKGERREGRAVGKWREVMRHRSSSAGRIDPPIPRHRDPVMPLGDGGRRWIFAKCWSSHGYGYGYGCRYGGGGRWRGLTSGGAALGRSEGGLGGASGGVGDVAAAERRSWIMPKTGEPHKGVAETNAEEEEVGEEAEGEKGEGEDWLEEEEVYGKMNTFEAVLDTKRVENDCQSAQHMRTAQERVGLFGYALLTEPKGFRTMTSEAIERSEELIARLKMTPPSIEIVKLLDEISNTVRAVYYDLDQMERSINGGGGGEKKTKGGGRGGGGGKEEEEEEEERKKKKRKERGGEGFTTMATAASRAATTRRASQQGSSTETTMGSSTKTGRLHDRSDDGQATSDEEGEKKGGGGGGGEERRRLRRREEKRRRRRRRRRRVGKEEEEEEESRKGRGGGGGEEKKNRKGGGGGGGEEEEEEEGNRWRRLHDDGNSSFTGSDDEEGFSTRQLDGDNDGQLDEDGRASRPQRRRAGY
ncbi:hypothetical protein CBR_g38872 [Chara braunii]|uniref:Uncharacterized protein n=1 Tax=Chara braunii TaxID=69332 RepID=A0A388LQQ1_CHABU|nr:hypothetical protein CBR_g38872 [Chara braunii]|eukprot:GBG84589.1 hypothetical protein CBR_g38872 [Chara braunii]